MRASKRKIGAKQIVAFVFGLVIVVAIFVYAIPKFADYGDVWNAMKTLTPIESLSLLLATIFNLFTYWLANQAALPGLKLSQSAVVTQTTTSVANTLPAGGAIAVGVTYAILGSWGFTAGETTLYVGVTGIWNIFTKLALPVIALALLVVTGHVYPALVGAAVVGIAVLAVAVVLLVLVFKSKAMARRVGEFIGSVVSAIMKPFKKGPITDMGDKAVKFRKETIVLVSRRWLRLTWTTVLSQLALFLVLLLSLRHMGVSEHDVATVEIFAVYAFSRLLSSIPITPGGVGVIDLGYIAGLSAFDEGEHAAIVAGVLIFRVLTYGIQIPVGAFTYFIWRRKRSWMRDTPPPGSIAGELEAQAAESAAA
jgi:putative heme transporter